MRRAHNAGMAPGLRVDLWHGRNALAGDMSGREFAMGLSYVRMQEGAFHAYVKWYMPQTKDLWEPWKLSC